MPGIMLGLEKVILSKIKAVSQEPQVDFDFWF